MEISYLSRFSKIGKMFSFGKQNGYLENIFTNQAFLLQKKGDFTSTTSIFCVKKLNLAHIMEDIRSKVFQNGRKVFKKKTKQDIRKTASKSGDFTRA